MRNDEAITQRLMEAGYIVIRFHHKEDWLAIVQKHPDVFGVPHHDRRLSLHARDPGSSARSRVGCAPRID